uniref:Uncharacterized protein n=1 Tax=Cairina moschata TaxID=8855 RepID=A0A8C3CIV4_CAIMO
MKETLWTVFCSHVGGHREQLQYNVVWQTSGKGDQILFAHTGQTSFSLFKEVSPSSRPITKPLFRHESVHIQDAKTDSEMHGTLLISKRRKEKGTMQNSMNTRGTASQNQQVLDNPSNIGTSEVMFSFLFIWFSGARVVWLVPGIHEGYISGRQCQIFSFNFNPSHRLRVRNIYRF